MNLYGLPPSNQNVIDNLLSIGVGVLMHSYVGVVSAGVFVYVCAWQREKESELLNVSVLAW